MAGSALSRRPSHPCALARVTASRLVPSSLSPPKAVFTERKRLIASTSAGLLVILDLDTSEADPYRIGTSTHREQRRWLLWRNEDQPLAW